MKQHKYHRTYLVIMTNNHQDNLNRRIFLTSISAAVLVGSFVIGSQLVEPSMAQDLGGQIGEQAGQLGEQAGQLGEQAGQLGEQAKEKVGGALQNLTGGANQTANRTGGALENLGEKAQSIMPGQ
jgi:hypothetical protein